MVDKLKFDQHFLKDRLIVNKVIRILKLNTQDVILEIGPGKGILTLELSKRAKKVIAVELDKGLKPYLDNLPNNIEVIYGNILEIINKLKFNKIISNLPYSISEPLFRRMIKLDFDMAVLLVGKKFSDLFLKEESKWSLIGKIFFDIRKIMDIPKGASDPKPRVNSVLLVFKKRKSKLTKLEQIIREFILQDDKKVKNALMYSLMKINNLTRRQSKEVIYNLKVPLNLFEKNVDYLSSRQFNVIYSKLWNYNEREKKVYEEGKCRVNEEGYFIDFSKSYLKEIRDKLKRDKDSESF